ncbi:hypothetical protein BaRGS_00002332 [Batillaria attramentaria]|uniref:Uncharacterized protein n=1 Tax=Batillaria attramentaria TaxID=370345 RepID=A0ABD0M410_9CAEN
MDCVDISKLVHDITQSVICLEKSSRSFRYARFLQISSLICQCPAGSTAAPHRPPLAATTRPNIYPHNTTTPKQSRATAKTPAQCTILPAKVYPFTSY